MEGAEMRRNVPAPYHPMHTLNYSAAVAVVVAVSEIRKRRTRICFATALQTIGADAYYNSNGRLAPSFKQGSAKRRGILRESAA